MWPNVKLSKRPGLNISMSVFLNLFIWWTFFWDAYTSFFLVDLTQKRNVRPTNKFKNMLVTIFNPRRSSNLTFGSHFWSFRRYVLQPVTDSLTSYYETIASATSNNHPVVVAMVTKSCIHRSFSSNVSKKRESWKGFRVLNLKQQWNDLKLLFLGLNVEHTTPKSAFFAMPMLCSRCKVSVVKENWPMLFDYFRLVYKITA